MKNYTTIKSYIAGQPKMHQLMLREMYQIIKSEAVSARETIKYGMPTFVGRQNIAHFAAMKGHLGFYPSPSAIIHFAKDLEAYSTSKGCVRFMYGKPLPKTLVIKMVKFRLKEDSKNI